MSATKTKKRIAELQQLCSLGYSSQLTVPYLIPLVREIFGADGAHFIWADAAGNPVNYAGDSSPEHASIQTFITRNRAIAMPGFRHYGEFLRTSSVLAYGGSGNDPYYDSPLYQDVLRPLDGHCIVGAVIRDGQCNPHGSLTLQRASRTRGFTATERMMLESIAKAFGLLFAPPIPEPDFHAEHCDQRGIAIYSTRGELLYCDTTATHLLALARNERFDVDSYRQRDDLLSQRIAQLREALVSVFSGRPANISGFDVSNAWGRFSFSGRWLEAATFGAPPAVCVTIDHYIPRRIATWKRMSRLDLTVRQQQVCLDFTEGRSLSEIAKKLRLSRHTVIDHVNRVYERFGIFPNRSNLVEFLYAEDAFPPQGSI